MRFGHYTVFDTPEENKHTQVYVEYDVPNKDNLDGATGTMILSDGSSESGGGGGDSRFSTCEVEVFFTKDGQPLTLDTADVILFNGYSPGPLPAVDESIDIYYQSGPKLDPDHTTIKPLLFEGAAYSTGANGLSGGNYYVTNSEVAPVCTGDISMGTFGDMPVIVIRGNGTITLDMMED